MSWTLIGDANTIAAWQDVVAELAVVAVTFFVAMTGLRIVDLFALRRRADRAFVQSVDESAEFWEAVEEQDPKLLERARHVDEKALFEKVTNPQQSPPP